MVERLGKTAERGEEQVRVIEIPSMSPFRRNPPVFILANRRFLSLMPVGPARKPGPITYSFSTVPDLFRFPDSPSVTSLPSELVMSI